MDFSKLGLRSTKVFLMCCFISACAICAVWVNVFAMTKRTFCSHNVISLFVSVVDNSRFMMAILVIKKPLFCGFVYWFPNYIQNHAFFLISCKGVFFLHFPHLCILYILLLIIRQFFSHSYSIFLSITTQCI